MKTDTPNPKSRGQAAGSDSSRQDSIEHHRNYCVHYDPQRLKRNCKAGCDIANIQCFSTGERGMKWGPCIEGHLMPNPLEVCPKWERPSMEDAEKYADGVEDLLRKVAIVDPFISKWRSKKPVDKRETVECPVCKGRLHLLQNSYNGHVRAACETPDCIRFIE